MNTKMIEIVVDEGPNIDHSKLPVFWVAYDFGLLLRTGDVLFPFNDDGPSSWVELWENCDELSEWAVVLKERNIGPDRIFFWATKS